MSILVIAEHDNANLKGATLNTVAAAKEKSFKSQLTHCMVIADLEIENKQV